MPAVAANATSATINMYSTSPWPLSSLWRNFSKAGILVNLLLLGFTIEGLNRIERTLYATRLCRSTQTNVLEQSGPLTLREGWMPKNTSKLVENLCRTVQRILEWEAINDSEAQDRKQRQGPQRRAKRQPRAPKLRNLPAANKIIPKCGRKNRWWQNMHRQGRMKKRLSIHSNTPCLLERRMSEDPHFKQTRSLSFMVASIRTCFLLCWIDQT